MSANDPVAKTAWKVKAKNGKEFYVIASTHIGLNDEFGEYYERVVVPIIKKTDIFVSENSVGYYVGYQYPRCLNEIHGSSYYSGVAILKKILFHEMNSAYVSIFKRDMSQDILDQMLENASSFRVHQALMYARFIESDRIVTKDAQMERKDGNLLSINSTEDEGNPFLNKHDLVSRAHLINPFAQLEAIEGADVFFKAFCETDASEHLLQIQIDRLINDKNGETNISELRNVFVRSIDGGYVDDFDEKYDEYILCNRNKYWIEKIEENTKREGKFTYILGAEHIHKPLSGAKCNGILTLMENQGYMISKVEME
ncbi:TraB/GumN family protein [Burkholderiaceae bacterium DAT-1]|nr:TraB/GumN family protein [Burkholderiaceae bacterium DAT-1]